MSNTTVSRSFDAAVAAAENEKTAYDGSGVCGDCGARLLHHVGWYCPPLSPYRRTRRGKPTYRGPLLPAVTAG